MKTKQTTQRGFVAWQGMTVRSLARFFATRPPMHWSRAFRIAALLPSSLTNSVLHQLERLLYSRKIAATRLEHPPVFILGHWRSGTTLLHNLMAADPRFTYANLYHVFFPNHFLLTESTATRVTRGLLPKTRPMDNMPCGWDLPQEDETALCLLTLLSPYLMLAFHGRHEKYDRFFELKNLTESEVAEWKAAFLLFLKKLTLRQPRPIVLKSPTHTYRIPILLEMFPDAKFVYIVRNPYDVFSSTMHLRRTLFDANGLCPLDTQGMEEDVLRTYEHLFQAYERDRHLIPPGHIHELRFEELETDPIGELRRVYEELDLYDFDPLEPLLQAQAQQLQGYTKNRYVLERPLRERVYKRWEAAFTEYGYLMESAAGQNVEVQHEFKPTSRFASSYLPDRRQLVGP